MDWKNYRWTLMHQAIHLKKTWNVKKSRWWFLILTTIWCAWQLDSTSTEHSTLRITKTNCVQKPAYICWIEMRCPLCHLGTIHIYYVSTFIAQNLIWLPNFSQKLFFFLSKQKNFSFKITFWQNFHAVVWNF